MLARAADDAGAADENAASSIRWLRGLGGGSRAGGLPVLHKTWFPLPWWVGVAKDTQDKALLGHHCFLC